MARDIDAAIAERARQQLGLITIEQARELGLTDRMRRRRIDQQLLLPMGCRTFRLAGVPPSWAVSVMADCLEAGSGSGASHLAAGALWSLRRLDEGPVEVVGPLSRARVAMSGPLHRSRFLPASHLTVRQGIPVTSAERTLADLSARLTYSMLEGCVDDALRRGLVTHASLAAIVGELRTKGRRGIPRLADILGDPTTGLASTRLERRFVAVLTEAGRPLPVLQARVEVRGRVFFLDALFEPEWLAVELDGHGTHATRRERQHDRERAALIAEAGIRLVEFTNEDVWERPQYVLATIDRHLQLARQQPAHRIPPASARRM